MCVITPNKKRYGYIFTDLLKTHLWSAVKLDLHALKFFPNKLALTRSFIRLII